MYFVSGCVIKSALFFYRFEASIHLCQNDNLCSFSSLPKLIANLVAIASLELISCMGYKNPTFRYDFQSRREQSLTSTYTLKMLYNGQLVTLFTVWCFLCRAQSHSTFPEFMILFASCCIGGSYSWNCCIQFKANFISGTEKRCRYSVCVCLYHQ